MAEELWHYVEARRDDGAPTMFRIRELDRRPELSRIFVVELPYPATELSRLPSAAAHRRLAELEEAWVRPACAALGWELVGVKTEDGSFFLYMYGASDPQGMIERLSPFDAQLGFYDDVDPEWGEYAGLRELLDQAKALPPSVGLENAAPAKPPKPKRRRRRRPAAKAPTPSPRTPKKKPVVTKKKKPKKRR